ncbi:hypothetical protein AK830_g4111 [Neonectria ditissima]|uniref:Uncharacterized protein n=1 Tax=Neonectria ditissima TaxID=78410 RepID=A0A0P7BGR7_9HYPO|nr:hypothetical protein AK830_g4111 [Neonectria ditissima]
MSEPLILADLWRRAKAFKSHFLPFYPVLPLGDVDQLVRTRINGGQMKEDDEMVLTLLLALGQTALDAPKADQTPESSWLFRIKANLRLQPAANSIMRIRSLVLVCLLSKQHGCSYTSQFQPVCHALHHLDWDMDLNCTALAFLYLVCEQPHQHILKFVVPLISRLLPIDPVFLHWHFGTDFAPAALDYLHHLVDLLQCPSKADLDILRHNFKLEIRSCYDIPDRVQKCIEVQKAMAQAFSFCCPASANSPKETPLQLDAIQAWLKVTYESDMPERMRSIVQEGMYLETLSDEYYRHLKIKEIKTDTIQTINWEWFAQMMFDFFVQIKSCESKKQVRALEYYYELLVPENPGGLSALMNSGGMPNTEGLTDFQTYPLVTGFHSAPGMIFSWPGTGGGDEKAVQPIDTDAWPWV